MDKFTVNMELDLGHLTLKTALSEIKTFLIQS